MNELPLHILVIDDEPRLSGQLRLLLESQGYSVTTAVGGAAGIAALQATDVDAVLTDVTMPDVDGYAVLQWVREYRSETPVIVMTGYGSLESSTRALRLGAYDYVLKPFSLPTVQAALSRASAAISKRRADQQRNAELAAVAAIARQMGRSLEPLAMADATLGAIVESTSSKAAMLYAVAEGSMRWTLWRTHGLPEELRPKLLELLPPSPLTKPSIIWDERPPWMGEAPFDTFKEWCDSGGKMALGAMPLEAGPNTPIVLLLIGEGRPTLSWSPPLLMSLGNALSMALVNTRLFSTVREERDRLRLLYGISRELATALDPDQLLSRIIQHTVAAVNAERGSIIIAPESGRPLQRIVARYGMDQSVTEPVAASLLTSGLSGWVMTHRTAVKIADVRIDKRWVELTNTSKRVRSALAVPLVREDQVLGVMTLTHPKVDHFSTADLDLVRSVSAQAAVAIENAHLFAELEQRVFDLEGLNNTSRELTSALDPMDVARKVAFRCAEMLDAPIVALVHIEEGNKLWPLITLVDGMEQPLMSLGPVRASLKNREPSIYTTAGLQAEMLTEKETPLGETWLGVPLVLGNAIDGILIAAHTRPNAFAAYERQLLTALAGQAAVAMESARLYANAAEERTTLSAVIKSVSDVIILTDNESIVVANPAASALIDTPTNELIGKKIRSAFPMLPPIKNDTPSNTEEVTINERVYAMHVSPLLETERLSGGQVVVLQDITHFKELDELKSRFVSMVSHDLKSPLTAIQGYAQLVASGHMGNVTEPQKKALQAVIRNSTAMTSLISDLLDIGRLEAGIGLDIAETDVVQIITDVIEEQAIRAEMKEITLHQDIPEGVKMAVDGPRLRQVFANLVSNAIKYTPPKGEVFIKASVETKHFVLSVKDTGYGIPEEALPHIFDRFYRVKRDTDTTIEGTGLGLAIVKGIVEEHHGTIEVTSEVGKGSNFKMSIPML